MGLRLQNRWQGPWSPVVSRGLPKQLSGSTSPESVARSIVFGGFPCSSVTAGWVDGCRIGGSAGRWLQNRWLEPVSIMSSIVSRDKGVGRRPTVVQRSFAGRWHARLGGIPTVNGSIGSVVKIPKFQNKIRFGFFVKVSRYLLHHCYTSIFSTIR